MKPIDINDLNGKENMFQVKDNMFPPEDNVFPPEDNVFPPDENFGPIDQNVFNRMNMMYSIKNDGVDGDGIDGDESIGSEDLNDVKELQELLGEAGADIGFVPSRTVDPEFIDWKKTKNPMMLSALLKKYQRLIDKEIPKYRGQLPDPILRTYAKKVTIDAIKTFDPTRSKLSTHIVNNLLRLHRKNYEISGITRLPEDIQRGVNMYRQTKEHLDDKLGREPTVEEISDELKWNKSRVIRTEKLVKKEVLSSGLDYAPARYEMKDPRLDNLYYDLDPRDKIIFQYKLGYNGYPVLTPAEIAKKLRISEAMVSIRAKNIAGKIQEIMNQRR